MLASLVTPLKPIMLKFNITEPFLYLGSKLTKINQVQIQEQFIYQVDK